MEYHHEPIPGLHPAFNFLLVVALFLFGRFLPELSFILLHYHIPPVILEILQSFAYIATIGMFAIAAYKFGLEKGKLFFKKKSKK